MPQHALDLDVVEVRGGLVGQDQRRIEAERTRDGDTLLLSARHVAGVVMETLAEADLLEQLDRSGPRRPWTTDRPRRIGAMTFSVRVEARHEVERLEHHADAMTAVLGQAPCRKAR